MPLDPTTIPDLKVWLDANDPASFAYSSGVLVSQWSDKSGVGYHFTQGTPSQQPSRNGSRNGLPTVAFDGARYMRRDQAAPFTNGACSIFIVCLETTHPQDYVGYLVAQTTAGQDHDQTYAFSIDAGASGVGTSFSCDRVNSKALIAQGHPAPFAVYGVTMAPAAGGVSIYKNGVAGTPAGTAVGTQPAPPGLCMGTRWLSAAPNMTYGLRGEIAEILVYSRVLTTTERQQVEQYLREKWLVNLNPADSVTVSDSLSFNHVLDLADSVTATDALALSAFDPTLLSGLRLWLDAGRLETTGWTNWPNLAPGSVAQLTGVGTPAPQTTTPVAGLNGLPVMRYAKGQGEHYATGLGVDREFTIFIVARMWGATRARVYSSKYNEAGSPNALLGWWGGYEDKLYIGAWATPDPNTPASTNPKLYTTDGTGTTIRLFRDGVLYSSNGGSTNGWGGTAHLNPNSQGFTEGSDVEVAEVVTYNRKLTDVERQQVEDYLRKKWLTPGAAQTLNLSDTVTVTDAAEIGFQFAMTMPPDTATVTDVLGIEVAISFADGVNVSDDPPILGAAHFVEPAETVTTSDLLGIALGEYVIPCTPDPIVGEFIAGQSVVGTWFVCAKKGILGLGAYAPALIRRDLAAEPAGLALGGEGALFVGQKPTIPGGGMYLGAYAPGFSLKLTPPLGALGLRTRIPRNVGIEPEIYEAGLELGGHIPKFVGKEPPVEAAALALGGIVPGFKFSQTLPAPAAGLQLGGGIPIQVEEILILPVPEHPVDLLPVNAGADLVAVGAPSVDLLSSPASAVTLEESECVPADLDELECV